MVYFIVDVFFKGCMSLMSFLSFADVFSVETLKGLFPSFNLLIGLSCIKSINCNELFSVAGPIWGCVILILEIMSLDENL